MKYMLVKAPDFDQPRVYDCKECHVEFALEAADMAGDNETWSRLEASFCADCPSGLCYKNPDARPIGRRVGRLHGVKGEE